MGNGRKIARRHYFTGGRRWGRMRPRTFPSGGEYSRFPGVDAEVLGGADGDTVRPDAERSRMTLRRSFAGRRIWIGALRGQNQVDQTQIDSTHSFATHFGFRASNLFSVTVRVTWDRPFNAVPRRTGGMFGFFPIKTGIPFHLLPGPFQIRFGFIKGASII